MNKKIKKITQMGFQSETQDPFLFCAHHLDYYPKGNSFMGPVDSLRGRNLGNDFQVKDGWRMYHGQRVPGFPNHPHRGFETVTIVLSGTVDHSDSLGAVGRYGSGDVQWMTAGSGIQHSEMFPLLNEEKENTLEIFQLWLNLPKANKLVEPHFTMFWKESIPKYTYIDEKNKSTEIEVIAGKLENIEALAPPPNSWANDKKNEVIIWIIKMESSAKWKISAASPGLNRKIYFFKGKSILLDNHKLSFYQSADLVSEEEISIENGEEKASLLFLQARPIKETVVQYGPFVMNTPEEIQNTFKDYQRTQFGGWPWESSEPTHSRNKGRFAKHSDGKEDAPKAIS